MRNTKGCKLESDDSNKAEPSLTTKSPETQGHMPATESSFCPENSCTKSWCFKTDRCKSSVCKVFEKQWNRCLNVQDRKSEKETHKNLWKQDRILASIMQKRDRNHICKGCSHWTNNWSITEEENPFLYSNADNCSAAYHVFHAANMLRGEILKMENKLPWLPRLEDLTEENVHVLDLLYNFLCWVLYGDASSGPISEERIEVPAVTCRAALSMYGTRSDTLYDGWAH